MASFLNDPKASFSPSLKKKNPDTVILAYILLCLLNVVRTAKCVFMLSFAVSTSKPSCCQQHILLLFVPSIKVYLGFCFCRNYSENASCSWSSLSVTHCLRCGVSALCGRTMLMAWSRSSEVPKIFSKRVIFKQFSTKKKKNGFYFCLCIWSFRLEKTKCLQKILKWCCSSDMLGSAVRGMYWDYVRRWIKHQSLPFSDR